MLSLSTLCQPQQSNVHRCYYSYYFPSSSTTTTTAAATTRTTTPTCARERERELTRPIRNIPPLRPHSALPNLRFVKLSLLQKKKKLHSILLLQQFQTLFWTLDANATFQEKRFIAIGSCCGNPHNLHMESPQRAQCSSYKLTLKLLQYKNKYMYVEVCISTTLMATSITPVTQIQIQIQVQIKSQHSKRVGHSQYTAWFHIVWHRFASK